jgi:DNA-directed RNA polymerase
MLPGNIKFFMYICGIIQKHEIMSTAELEKKKARLARSILNEKDEDIVVLIAEHLRRIKRFTIDATERKKLINEFLQFAEINGITDSDFKFNREACYDR